MSAKKPAKDSPSQEDRDMQAIEDKVKRMLDPNEPDPEPEIPEDLPSEIKIVPKAGEPEVTTAPEVKAGKKAARISVQHDSDDSHEVEPAPIEAAESETAADDQPEEEETEADASGPAEEEAATDQVEPELTSEETKVPEETDAETAKAVDEIARQESDELLAHEDKEIARAFEDKKTSFAGRLKNFFSAWWHNRLARRATTLAVVIGLAASVTVPTSRYFLLNTFGVRSGASVKVLDESTRQPLKNVQVRLRGQTALTDNEGVAKLKDIKLGSTELVIEKRAFAPIRQPVTLGWGSNPLGDRSITPVGSQYAFTVSDYLSGKPLAKIEATSGEASAFSDEDGKIKLTIDKTDDSPVEVKITGAGLREENVTIGADDKSDHAVVMVPGRKHVFISKRSGKYDVYKIDVDGRNEELVLPGTGSERGDVALLAHPTKDLAALVSTRGNVRNSDRYLLSKLTLIDLSDNSTVEVAQSERVQLVDWVGDRVVYVQIAAGTSAANPQRHRLMSYDHDSEDNEELASSNYFNDVVVARGSVYYAPSSAYQTSDVALYKVNADGTNRQTAFAEETWNVYRTSYAGLVLAVGQDWYEYSLTSNSSNQLGGEPANLRPRLYADSPNGDKSLWIDQRDGKGVLLARDIAKNEDKEIHQRSGLKAPIRWLNGRSVVFRIGTDQETADYAVSLDGGEPKKIRDVTGTADISDWYYY